VPTPITDRSLDPRLNQVLRALPADELDRVTEALEPVALDVRETVYDLGKPVDYLYFPTAGVLSQVALVDGDTAVEVNTIGRDGVAGLPAFLGASLSPNQVFCQVAAEALRLPIAQLQPLLVADGDLRDVLHRFTQASIVTIAQNVACNLLHTTEERASRWLLLTHDRVDGDTFLLTQEFLAQMLGVRRATVSVTAGALQAAGLISYSRGRITIVDRAGLEDASCDCYALVRDEVERLLGG
jgi:CRP-like cAMP-binding protein